MSATVLVIHVIKCVPTQWALISAAATMDMLPMTTSVTVCDTVYPIHST